MTHNGSAPPGLRLKERVRSEELSPQAAMNLLRNADEANTNDKNPTFRWLARRGAK